MLYNTYCTYKKNKEILTLVKKICIYFFNFFFAKFCDYSLYYKSEFYHVVDHFILYIYIFLFGKIQYNFIFIFMFAYKWPKRSGT